MLSYIANIPLALYVLTSNLCVTLGIKSLHSSYRTHSNLGKSQAKGSVSSLHSSGRGLGMILDLLSTSSIFIPELLKFTCD